MVRHSLSNSNEDLSIVLEQVSTLHSWASWLRSNHEGIVNIFESGDWVSAAHNLVKEWECAIVELGLNTLEFLFSKWQVDEVKNNSLVLSKEFT